MTIEEMGPTDVGLIEVCRSLLETANPGIQSVDLDDYQSVVFARLTRLADRGVAWQGTALVPALWSDTDSVDPKRQRDRTGRSALLASQISWQPADLSMSTPYATEPPVAANDIDTPGRTSKSATVTTVLAGVFLIITLASPTNAFGSSYAALAAKVFAFLGLLVMLAVQVRRVSRTALRSHVLSPMYSLSFRDVRRLQRLTERTEADFTSLQALLFVQAIVSPNESQQRLVEEYDIKARVLEKHVAIDIRIPQSLLPARRSSDEEAFAVPIMVLPKGELVDNLHVRGSTSESLVVLTYSEYLELVAASLRRLIGLAYSGGPVPQPAREAEYLALQDILTRGPLPDTEEGPGLRALADLAMPNAIWGALALEFARRLVQTYAIVVKAPIDDDGRSFVRYERTVVPLSAHQYGILGRLREQLSDIVGFAPASVTIPLATACTARSYHLTVRHEGNVYLAEQHAKGLEEYLRRAHESIGSQNAAATPPYTRFRPRHGQPYSHFYSRFFPPPSDGEDIPSITFTFREMPFGAPLMAAVIGVLTAVAVWLAGTAAELTQAVSPNVGIVLLVGAPAVVTWRALFGRPVQARMEESYPVWGSIAISGLASFLAILLYGIYSTEPFGHFGRILIPSFSILGLRDLPWVILVVVAVLNSFLALFRYVTRSWLYWRAVRVNRPDFELR